MSTQDERRSLFDLFRRGARAGVYEAGSNLVTRGVPIAILALVLLVTTGRSGLAQVVKMIFC